MEQHVWHKSSIYTNGDGTATVNESTNDNLDQGYPSEYANWELTFPSVEDAIKHTGHSRQGCLCEVVVFLDGERI